MFFNKSFKHNFIELCISFVIIIDSFIYLFILICQCDCIPVQLLGPE